MNSDKIILSLCSGTGSWEKPYFDNGYDVYSITLPDYDVLEAEFINYVGEEEPRVRFRGWIPEFHYSDIKVSHIYGILAAPPCTMFSIARNDKTAKEPRDLRKGMRIINACMEIVHECLYYNHRLGGEGLKFWALENPYTGYLKRFLGEPPLIFDPCDYGDYYSKKTALWGEFKPLKIDKQEPIKINYVKYASSKNKIREEKEKLIPEGYQVKTGFDKRKIMRSITPQGFAKAFYEANK